MNILLAIDGSTFSEKAADYVVRHFEYLKTPPNVHLLHVVEQLPLGLFTSPLITVVDDELNKNFYKSQAEPILDAARKSFALKGISVASVYLVGNIAAEISRYATENHIDLIVAGSHGRTALKGILLGSVSSKIIAATSKPVLIIR